MTVEDQYQQKFILPKIIDNANGWGPIESDIPESLVDVPYTPYSKSEAIGKVADWTQTQDVHDKRRNYQNRNADQIYGSGLANAFNYHFAAEEENSFSLVDRATSTTKKTSGYRPVQKQIRNGRNPRQNFRGGFQPGFNRNRRNFNRQDTKFIDDSVKIGEQWNSLEELDMNAISKATLAVGEPTDISVCGTLNYFNPAMDNISAKNNGVPLKDNNRIIHNPSTADDEIIQSIAKATEGRAVFATDSIISTLMCAPRSVYPWDIIITKYRDQVFFDKRDDSQSFDYYTVNENGGDLPGDPNDKSGINTPVQLSEETTSNCKNFAQQTVNEDMKYQFQKPYPFNEDDEENIGSVAYRYRKWTLNSANQQPISLIVRTTLDAAYQQKNNLSNNCESMKPKESEYPLNETLFMNIRTVDEFDLTRNMNWRKQLDERKVSNITSEFKNNYNKLSKWAIESILSGADQVKFGFISRVHSKNNKNHAILGTHSFKPTDFANHLQVNINNAWGILKEIVDKLMKLDDGKYVLVKDAVKNTFTLYSVPENAFDESENEDEDY